MRSSSSHSISMLHGRSRKNGTRALAPKTSIQNPGSEIVRGQPAERMQRSCPKSSASHSASISHLARNRRRERPQPMSALVDLRGRGCGKNVAHLIQRKYRSMPKPRGVRPKIRTAMTTMMRLEMRDKNNFQPGTNHRKGNANAPTRKPSIVVHLFKGVRGDGATRRLKLVKRRKTNAFQDTATPDRD